MNGNLLGDICSSICSLRFRCMQRSVVVFRVGGKKNVSDKRECSLMTKSRPAYMCSGREPEDVASAPALQLFQLSFVELRAS